MPFLDINTHLNLLQIENPNDLLTIPLPYFEEKMFQILKNTHMFSVQRRTILLSFVRAVVQ